MWPNWIKKYLAAAEKDRAAYEARMNAKAHVVATIDTGKVFKFLHGASRSAGYSGESSAKQNAQEYCEFIAKRGIWDGDSLIPPHRITSLVVKDGEWLKNS